MKFTIHILSRLAKRFGKMDGETGYQYHGARYYNEELGRYMSTDRFAEKFFHQSPYVYAGNMPISAIDVNGDSIILTAAFKNHAYWKKSYDIWKKSKEGKAFIKDYGIGGKYEHIPITFDIADPIYYPSGNGDDPQIDKSDKATRGQTEIKISALKGYPIAPPIPGTKIDNAEALVNGTDKEQRLGFTMYFNSQDGKNRNGNWWRLDRAHTILHETQHVRINMKYLLEESMIKSSEFHHDLMKEKNGEYFQERYEFYRRNEGYWINQYEKWKEKGVADSKKSFVEYEINNFKR